MGQNNNRKLDEDRNSQLDVIDQVEEPKMYRVLLHNDDYTPMDFVVHVLIHFFSLSPPEAQRVMLDVHEKGFGVAGVFSFEVAETKVAQVNQFAKASKHPLKCSYEEEP